MKKEFVIVTGGLGFIGSSVVKKLLNLKFKVLNLDSLTYAANLEKLKEFKSFKNHYFYKCDITDAKKLNQIFNKYKPKYVLNLAAESHVDNSINNPKNFINTNIIGTYNLLVETNKLYQKNYNIKFVQISTDEVYGDVVRKNKSSKENDAYVPSSPYSASKASSDHLVRSWSRTYGIKYNITCSANNYGPYQNNEKLIPVIIKNIVSKKKIPIYGNGLQKRNWIYVEDNADAIIKVALSGKDNSTYNIGSNNDFTNKFMVKAICKILCKEFKFNKNIFKLISYVKDRPGHDLVYKVNYNKIKKELKWKPKENFNKSITKTIQWYLKKFE
jgi:dTDP-glucose 4,6-dehydratase